MANNNSPFGFRPVARVGGAPFSTVVYGKPSADTHTIFIGDVVQKKSYAQGSGQIALPESVGGTMYLPTIQTGYQGTPGTGPWLGVTMNYGAASTATVHMVNDEVDCIFMAQNNGAANTHSEFPAGETIFTTSPGAGKNANIDIATNTGSTTTKLSGMMVDNAGVFTTNTLDLRILKVSTISPNVEGTAYPILEVLINNHFFAPNTAGV